MRLIALLLLTLLPALASFGQAPGVWVRFVDTTTDLSGYKDLDGTIKIPPRFEGFTRADTFHHIIAVNEGTGASYTSYYLLKDGRKVGQDSVYVFDFTFDCESEGKILFRDRKKDRVGYLDRNGVAIIPAVYNYATPFRNGMAVAQRNAVRQCWDETEDTSNCEHLGWAGGETVLINEQNEVLADSIGIDTYDLNWYSLRMNDPTVDTSVYVNIPGCNGNVYSFLDYTREFRKWFTTIFVPSLEKENVREHLFSEITYWSNDSEWVSLEQEDFVKTFPASITSERFGETALKQRSLSSTLFNELIYDKPVYKKYLGPCGEHNRDRFPLFNVMLTYYKRRTTPLPTDLEAESSLSDFDKGYNTEYQEHFEFLRTEEGYKLLRVSLKEMYNTKKL